MFAHYTMRRLRAIVGAAERDPAIEMRRNARSLFGNRPN